MLTIGQVGKVHYTFGGEQLVAILSGEPARWSVEAPWEEIRREHAAQLNEFFDPEKLYKGPSDGYYADRVVSEAAAFMGGTAELPNRLDAEDRVY